MSSEPHELDYLIRHEERDTAGAWCVSVDEDTFEKEAERIFLPKSKCELMDDGKTFLVPEWLAIDKGLV